LGVVRLLDHAHIVVRDLGGIQEEAPCLGKPVVIVLVTTERVETVGAGTVVVVGTETDKIIREVIRLLGDQDAHQAMARAVNPYGDGHATRRITDALADRGLLPT
jgi:UDP-N-acetylglucosamine 2-epimerase (non-hydrolysing)